MANMNTGAAGEKLTSLPPGDVAAALDAVAGSYVSEMVTDPQGGEHFFVGGYLRRESFAPLNPELPDFVTQTETLIEPKSFIDYLVAFKSSTAICKASLSKNSIVAVLDYHGQARVADRDSAAPGRCAHVVALNCPFDVDYAKWRKIFGTFLSQDDMLAFLEDMIHTIARPVAGDLLEAFSDVEVERVVKFRTRRNDKTGTLTVLYDEQEGDGTRAGTLELPDLVSIVVPIFQGGMAIELVAKVRVRPEKGMLTFGLVVAGLEKLERDAFRSIGEDVRTSTGTPVFYTA